MKHFIIENGNVTWLTKEEFDELPGQHVSEVIKDMTAEELERFKKERYEKFVKPLMEYNVESIERKRESQKTDWNR
ncbi:hypothetical protein SAMN05216232_0458 [Virgibacillus subterraneus]|uniref:Uncharacterized protein n=2 Tax=Virgibacillus TaxID=84406 RepID=A0A1H0XZK9_9BACI|nr:MULTISPECIES: hypothetical protein [Virgibacillus]SDQ08349.1 hypothetical protein SAMN05216231_0329 [Virgibacillus salinus]SEP64494.1 hypothetical protein SAMN05216232_0458 [Virgibacillus subterraneus]